MKLQALVPFISLMASLAASHPSTPAVLYDEICPQHNGVEEEVQSGVFVRYHCNERPSTRARTSSRAASPQECAISCSESSNCKGSVWVGQRNTEGQPCIHYHQSASTITDPARKVVYMTHRLVEEKDDGLFGEECEAENARIDELEEKLERCESGPDDGDDTDQLNTKCPLTDRSIEIAGGKDYKVFCKRLDDWGHNSQNLKSPRRMKVKECLEECSRTTDCDRAIWGYLRPDGTALCYLRPYTDRAGPVPTRRSGWHSAHVRE